MRSACSVRSHATPAPTALSPTNPIVTSCIVVYWPERPKQISPGQRPGFPDVFATWRSMVEARRLTIEIGHPTMNTLPTRMICKSYDPVAKRKKNSFVPSAGNRVQTLYKMLK
jgi:hypothetical protein